ncbi:AGAP005748-PA-like protein [Anopheles sinensis]|uniref:AGAP005748-PA-like protein n=1 Tax=Anopheles sinensis TaxID=74873 RepID=A0A084WJL3_ANOSI|nr:AGAP005748-PA-like protein [Anopheles sinensis]
MDEENGWVKEEVEELIAILKEREILCQPEGKKTRALDTFKVVADDLRSIGMYRTPDQIRTKLRTLRKQYFKASRSRNKNAHRACAYFPLLHDLFTDAQKKRDAKEAQAELSHQRHQQRHQEKKHQLGNVTGTNYHSRSSTIRSVSGSSISSMPSPQSYHNGYDHHQHHHYQRHKYSASIPFGANYDLNRRHVSPVRQVIPDKYHLKLNEYQPNLNNSLANLCKNDRYADVLLFVCNDEDTIAIPAHRLILGTFSSYFANVFEKANLLSLQTIPIVLPPMITRSATHCLLQYMYTGEAIVPAEMLDEVMQCGELLRIYGFCKKMAPSMLSQKGQPGLVSMPLVSVTKNLSMDPEPPVSNPRKRKHTISPRPTPSPTPTPSRSPTPPPASSVVSEKTPPSVPTQPTVPVVPVEKPLPVPEKPDEPVVRPEAKSVTPPPEHKEPKKEISDDVAPAQGKRSPREMDLTAEQTRKQTATDAIPETPHPDTPPSLPPSPACSRTSRAPSPPCPVSPPTPISIPPPTPTPAPALGQRKSPEKTRSPPRDIIEELDNMVTLTSDESMMEIVTKSPGSRNSPFSTHTNSPIGTNDENGPKLEALIEFDYDELNLPNTSMDDQPCVDLDNEDDDDDDHQLGTPLDQLVYSRLNCQLCHESFTTPTGWVQHVSGHCIMDQGLVKRRRISSNDGNSLDSAFRCDMCSSYFISAYDWQSHVAEAHEGA